MSARRFDLILVGRGLAALSATLELLSEKTPMSIALISEGEGASPHAQGGLAAALHPPLGEGSLESHLQDTLTAGAGACDSDAVEAILKEGHEAARWLLDQSVPFARENGALHLTKEGGHSERRVLHIGAQSGHFMMLALNQALENHLKHGTPLTRLQGQAARLLQDSNGRIAGLEFLDPSGRLETLHAPRVLLCTGGATGLFKNRTLEDASQGDGLMLAYDSGATLLDLEFTQFHPTTLLKDGFSPLLLSEALRGEGARLLSQGAPFMSRYDPRLELAPRDIVASAVFQELQEGRRVTLDWSPLPRKLIREHFGALLNACLERGIDPLSEGVPVHPAAHFSMGGIETDLEGRTGVCGLWAAGECARTGLHGANRLASNSLLECVVMGRAAARSLKGFRPEALTPGSRQPEDFTPPSTTTLEKIQSLLSSHLGLQREETSLLSGLSAIRALNSQASSPTDTKRLNLASLMLQSALLRRETRGAHRRLDFPSPLPLYTPIRHTLNP